MFENIKNFADLKKAYHKAARENHPDLGGDTETMKKINNDFDRAAKRIERDGETFGTEQAAEKNGKTTETAQDLAEFAEILGKLYGLDGLDIELCGSWLWITGNTYTHREAIKVAGCKWSKNKQAWYWHKGEYTRKGKRRYDMDEIRAMHGSEKIRGSAPKRIAV